VASLARLTTVAVLATVLLASPAQARERRAGILIRDDDGAVRRMCVFFDEKEISGVELLRRSGIDAEIDEQSLGAAVCRIGATGCSSGDCFCRYPTFWGYWVRDAGDAKWRFSDEGAADRTVRDGSMDGWSFGKDGKPAPPEAELSEVCAASSRTTPAVTRAETSASRPATERPDYLPFVGMALVLVVLGVAVTLRRRRD
jgi:hypothetical protein